MELSILEYCGLPEGSILSVRSGPTRRQSPLPCAAPFKLPAGPWPQQIDVLALLGKSQAGASLAKLDGEGRCQIPLEARDGRKMSVTLQVFDGKNGARAKKDAGAEGGEAANGGTPARRRDTEAEARAYLDRHRLHEFMHALFELLLKEKPKEPYSFIAARFREEAKLELKSGPPAELAAVEAGGKVSLSCVSTAPTSSALVQVNSLPPQPAPAEGNLQVTIKNMRGRSLARLAVNANDKVSSLKGRLETSLGVPASAQQLLWWAECLPNSTTLEIPGVPAGVATLHLVCYPREPRLAKAISGSSDGGLRLWSLTDGELIRDYAQGGPSAVLAVSVSWEMMLALGGLSKGWLQLWNLETGACMKEIEGHKVEVNCLEVDWPSMRAVSGSSDGTAKYWQLEEGKCLQTLMAGTSVYSLAINWSKGKAFGGLKNGNVRMWDMATGSRICDLTAGAATASANGTGVSAVAIDCCENQAVSGFEDGHLAFWRFHVPDDANTGGGEKTVPSAQAPTKLLLAHYCAVRIISAKWSAGDNQALCGSDDGSLSFWRLDTQECIARFCRHVGFVWTIHVDWKAERAMSGAFDGCVKLWDLRTGDCLRTLQAHSRPVRSVAAG